MLRNRTLRAQSSTLTLLSLTDDVLLCVAQQLARISTDCLSRLDVRSNTCDVLHFAASCRQLSKLLLQSQSHADASESSNLISFAYELHARRFVRTAPSLCVLYPFATQLALESVTYRRMLALQLRGRKAHSDDVGCTQLMAFSESSWSLERVQLLTTAADAPVVFAVVDRVEACRLKSDTRRCYVPNCDVYACTSMSRERCEVRFVNEP